MVLNSFVYVHSLVLSTLIIKITTITIEVLTPNRKDGLDH